MKKWVFLFLLLGISVEAGSDPLEGILTYYDPQTPGSYHVMIRNDRFATLIRPADFGISDSLWVIRGIWSMSGMVGSIRVALCEDDTTHPDWDHFPGDTIRFVQYFDPPGSDEDSVYFENEVVRSNNRDVWIFFDYEVDGVPFMTSGTEPPVGRNLARMKSPPFWWSDIDDWSVGLIVRYEPLVGIEADRDISIFPAFQLQQNAPNPFNPSTTIRFDLRQPAEVSLNIFDFRGRLVRALKIGRASSGRHEVVWDGRDEEGRRVSSGVYLYRLRVGREVETRKMLLVK